MVFEIYMVEQSSVGGASWYIYYCDFVSYLLVISNFLEQKVILLLQKIGCYITFHIIYSTSGKLHIPKGLTCFKFNYCIML